MTTFALFISQGRLKYEKVHTIYKRYIDIEDHDPTLVSKRQRKCLAYILDAVIPGIPVVSVNAVSHIIF